MTDDEAAPAAGEAGPRRDRRAVRQLGVADRRRARVVRVASASPRRRSTATTSTGSRAGRPRAAAGRSSATASTARPARSRPRRSTSATASTSTAAARTWWTAGGSSRPTSPTGGCTGSTRTGRPTPVAITPGGRGATPTCGSTPPASACTPSARRTTGREHGPPLVVNELVAIALDGSDGPGRVLVAGPDFVAAPRPSPDGDPPRLDRVGPPGHALGRDPAAGRRRRGATGRSASRGPSPAARGSPSSSRPGARPACCTPSRTRPGGGTCTRSTARTASTGRRATSRRWTPSWASPPGASAISSYGVPRRTARSWRSRAPTARDGILRIEPDGTVTRLDPPFTEVDGLRVADGAIVAIGAGPREAAILVRLTRRRAR